MAPKTSVSIKIRLNGIKAFTNTLVFGHLQHGPEVFVRQVGDAEPSRRLALQKPRATLALRVYQDRESRCARYQDPILHTQLIRRQTLCTQAQTCFVLPEFLHVLPVPECCSIPIGLSEHAAHPELTA